MRSSSIGLDALLLRLLPVPRLIQVGAMSFSRAGRALSELIELDWRLVSRKDSAHRGGIAFPHFPLRVASAIHGGPCTNIGGPYLADRAGRASYSQSSSAAQTPGPRAVVSAVGKGRT